ncbi:MAG: hypothetical protein QNK23_00465 [Crocinitomicaceae bacterium]|nr:hypothetical protein [Crocinitomicaceae bacterium]
MKTTTILFTFFIGSFVFAQNSEDLVPKHAVSVFSVNNVNLLQKISLDDLVKYEFMEEVQQELFDGSTAGKTLKDSGIDFDQKLNIFFGRAHDFELSGFTFGIKDKDQLFEVFDDFLPAESSYDGVDFYESYFNRIAIKGNSGILFRVSPNMQQVNSIADSIWVARGNDDPWMYEYPELQEVMYDLEQSGELDTLMVEEIYETYEYEDELPIADEDPNTKTYYELRDSVEVSMQQLYFEQVCNELFVSGENLRKSSPEFEEKLAHDAEGVFYFDNARSLTRNSSYYSLRKDHPNFYKQLEELYAGNILTGDLVINDQSIELKIDAKYGEQLGDIYANITDAKFDKNILKYIHKDNSAFFTFRVNLREAYEQAFKTITPMLESEDDQMFTMLLMMWELYDEFLNKDAMFDAYRGSVFGTYNGIKKVKTKKYIFEYDEETFDYTEEEVEAEEDMPLFAIGFSTGRLDIAERYLERMSRIEPSMHNEGDYWVVDQAILDAAPMYMILKNDLFIVTNDEDMARNHSEGYGADAIDKKLLKKAQKSGFMYGYADLGRAIENVPRDLFNDEENEMIDVIRGKSGMIEFTSTETSSEQTSFNLIYNFEGEYESTGTYILDLINSLYVITK